MILKMNVSSQAVSIECEKCGRVVSVEGGQLDAAAACKSVTVALLGLYKIKASFCEHIRPDFFMETMDLVIRG